jgi:hypothetical protein
MKRHNSQNKATLASTASDSNQQQKTLFQLWNNNKNNKTTNQSNSVSISSTNSSSNLAKNTLLKTANKPQTKSSYSESFIVLDDNSNERPPENKKMEIDFCAYNEIENMDADEEEIEDLELIQATETFMQERSFHNNTSNLNNTNNQIVNNSLARDTSQNKQDLDALAIGIDENQIQCTQYADIDGFDKNSGSIWIYPNNFPIRSYQYNIVEQCLYKNTMVVLPTGMGKTFIAAVVMFNFYRWYPFGKIVFMAPTKPLVTQQADACYKIVGIPKEDMTFMTGQTQAEKRKLLWENKRVFFITPQVISNDILRGTLDVNIIKCVVIDEAHKALGEYAFCKVKFNQFSCFSIIFLEYIRN